MKKSSISRFNNNLSTMFIVDESNNEIKAYELEPEYKELTGGGSSDFTTAQLTVHVAEGFSGMIGINGAFYGSEGDDAFSYGSEPEIIDEWSIAVILYKGAALLTVNDNGSVDIATSGDITDMGDGFYMMTGDAVLTLSNK